VDEVERDDFKVEGAEVAVELDEEAGVVLERNFLLTLTAVNFLMGWVKWSVDEEDEEVVVGMGGVEEEVGGGREGDGTGEGALTEAGSEAAGVESARSVGGWSGRGDVG